jgi:hypothetical protein
MPKLKCQMNVKDQNPKTYAALPVEMSRFA